MSMGKRPDPDLAAALSITTSLPSRCRLKLIGRNLGLGGDASRRLANPSSTPAVGPSGD